MTNAKILPYQYIESCHDIISIIIRIIAIVSNDFVFDIDLISWVIKLF